MELNMVMECAQLHQTIISEFYSRFDEHLAVQADGEFDSLLVYNILRFFFMFLWEEKFLTQPWWPQNIGKH